MTLDTLLRKNITTETKDSEITINPNYNSGKFLETMVGINELKALNTETAEDIAKYATITGENGASYSSDELELRQKTKVEGAQETLAEYSVRHYDNLLNELDKPTQTNLAFGFCPEKDIKDAAKYNTTRQKIKKAQKTLKDIRDNPKTFLTKLQEKETPLMNMYITRFADEYIQLKQREAERSGMLTIAHYGAEKFLKETKTHIETQAKTLMTKRNELKTIMDQKVDEEEIKHDRILTSIEKAKLLANNYKNMETLSTDYPDAQIFGQLIGETSSLAAAAIKKKAENEKGTGQVIAFPRPANRTVQNPTDAIQEEYKKAA